MFILEGNMGVGKSTFLRLLGERFPSISVIQEPQDTWSNKKNGSSLLENFYTDPKRWAYTIETMTMFTRVKDHMVHQEDQNMAKIMERSVYSGHYCFAMNGRAHGFLSDLEWDIYMGWADLMVNKQCQPPRGFIYLRAEPNICHERVKVRDRKGEETVSLEYVSQIHDWHEKFLIHKTTIAPRLRDIPVLVLDATPNILTDSDLREAYLQKAADFILSHAQHAQNEFKPAIVQAF